MHRKACTLLKTVVDHPTESRKLPTEFSGKISLAIATVSPYKPYPMALRGTESRGPVLIEIKKSSFLTQYFVYR